MALYSSKQLRAASPPRTLAARPAPPATAELLARLEREPRKPAISRRVFVGLVRIADFALLTLAGFGAHAFVGAAPGPSWAAPLVATGLALAAVLVFQTLRVYSLPALRFPPAPLIRIAGGWGALTIAALAVAAATGDALPGAEPWLIAWFWAALAALVAERGWLAALVARLAREGRFERRAVVVGGGTPFARELILDLIDADSSEARLIGLFDDRGDERSPPSLEGAPKLGTVDDLVGFARRTRVDLVIFALPITAERRIQDMLRKLWVLPVDVRLAAHSSRLRFRPRAYSYIGRSPMLDVFDRPLADWDIVLKALFDRIIGGLALLLLSPVMLAAAIALKLETRGPVLFKQIRYGFNNELITVYKFRSMRQETSDPAADQLVSRGDPRVTRVGRFLRRTSIDELPQLFNVVFRGDLSLVGPRPHALHAKAADRQYDEVVDGYFARHRVKPGLTGWAQIHGWRGETDTSEKIQKRVDHDLYYIENWSIFLDLYILAATPWALIAGRNAY